MYRKHHTHNPKEQPLSPGPLSAPLSQPLNLLAKQFHTPGCPLNIPPLNPFLNIPPLNPFLNLFANQISLERPTCTPDCFLGMSPLNPPLSPPAKQFPAFYI